MRLLLSADWHLGRLFHHINLLDDQAVMVEQFLRVAKEEAVDAVILAGDIYDRAIAHPDAVSLFDEALAKLSLDLHKPVFIVAGNHDSPKRLAFASRLLHQSGVHLVGELDNHPTVVSLEDKHGPVQVALWPYAEPAVAQQVFKDDAKEGQDTIRTMTQAAQVWMQAVRSKLQPQARHLLVGHAFAVGGEVCESERPLTIGTVDAVSTEVFSDFDLVLLGHLHKAQKVGSKVRYPGSPLKYSFSEEHHKKSFTIFDLKKDGSFEEQRLAVDAKHDVRSLQAPMKDLLADPDAFGPKHDYLHVVLTDEEPVWDAVGKLRNLFPNLLMVERKMLDISQQALADRPHFKEVDTMVMVESFYKAMTQKELSEDDRNVIVAELNQLERDKREVS